MLQDSSTTTMILLLLVLSFPVTIAWLPHHRQPQGSFRAITAVRKSEVAWAAKIASASSATGTRYGMQEIPTASRPLELVVSSDMPLPFWNATSVASSDTPTASSTTTTTSTLPSRSPRPPPPARALDVSAEINLPFRVELAYDSFSDLTRQPEWSPWLHSVEYVEPNDDSATTSTVNGSTPTKWTLKVMGVSYSWISVATKQERPFCLEWKSVSGLRNFGRVQFTPIHRNNNTATTGTSASEQQATTPSSSCNMQMTMTFVPPRLVAALFRNPNGVKRFMERKLIGSSLQMFRDVVIDTTLINAKTTETENYQHTGPDNTNATMIFFPI